jgi:hypothetical protein
VFDSSDAVCHPDISTRRLARSDIRWKVVSQRRPDREVERGADRDRNASCVHDIDPTRTTGREARASDHELLPDMLPARDDTVSTCAPSGWCRGPSLRHTFRPPSCTPRPSQR